MSWLYSIVFASLAISSQNGMVTMPVDLNAPAATVEKPSAGEETERFEQTYPLNANGRVAVSNVNGSIVIEAWDRNEVKLEAVKTADTKEALGDVEIKVDSRPDSFRVEASYEHWRTQGRDHWKGNRLEVQFRLWVPRGAVLNEIGTVNGAVTVSNFSNYTKISAVNGDVKATNLRGTANLSTVNGEVAADFDRLETGSRISLSTVNGKVNLMIPSDSNVTLRADSVNGSITNDFGLPVRKGQYVGRDLYGRVGTGVVQVKLSSVNGALVISRKNDGRNPAPATNLLPQKNKDDEDGNDDNDDNGDGSNEEFVNNTAKINRNVANAVKRSQKDAAEAKKESLKIKPAIKLDELREAVKDINNARIQEDIRRALEGQPPPIPGFPAVHVTGGANVLGSMPRVEKKSSSFSVKGIPKITVNAAGCGVRIRSWDKQEVQYTLTQFSESRDRVAARISERHTDSDVDISVTNLDQEARHGHFLNGMKSVRIEVFVPRKSNVKVVTNGEIRVDGVFGDIELRGANEAINVRDSDGKLTLVNADGVARVIGFRGQLDATTADGDVFLEGEFESLKGNAVDGSYLLTVRENVNATILSNTEIKSEGVVVSRDNEGKWRLGKGGTNYTFNFTEGRLILRAADDIATL